jgi:hypothetical protein
VLVETRIVFTVAKEQRERERKGKRKWKESNGDNTFNRRGGGGKIFGCEDSQTVPAHPSSKGGLKKR